MGVAMSEFAGFDFDGSTALAWSKFQARLADHVAEMEDDALLIVGAESSVDEDEGAGAAPYVQFCAFSEDQVRCEMSSNEYLAAKHRLDPVGVETLKGLGWSAPTCDRDDEDPGEGSANFYLDVDRSHADQLAVMTVTAFRDVFGVAHPVFLSSGELAEDDESALDVPTSPRFEVDPDEPIAVMPSGREHLQSMVDEALTPVLGHVPEHDQDGDIPVVSDSALVFVKVLEGVPAIQMFAPVVHDVTALDRAALEVAILNRDMSFIKFVLTNGRVLAFLEFSAWPFAPEHLRTMLALMFATLDQVDEDLTARVGGSRTFETALDEDEYVDEEDDEDECEGKWCRIDEDEDEDEDDEVDLAWHPALVTLNQLDAESRGSVDPELAASICEMDRDLILGLIRVERGQEIQWREDRDQAIQDGDPDEDVKLFDNLMRHAQFNVKLLRRALRVVVEQKLGRQPKGEIHEASDA